MDPKIVGGWKVPSGFLALAQGEPNSLADIDDLDVEGDFDETGFALVAVPSLPENVPSLTEKYFRRSVQLTYLRGDGIRIDAEACLPRDSLLSRWASSGTLSATEFVVKLTGIRFHVYRRASAPYRETLSTKDEEQCRVINARVSMPPAQLFKSDDYFPDAPTDVLTFIGFRDVLIFDGAASHVTAPDTVAFRGGIAGQYGPRIETDFDQLSKDVRSNPGRRSENNTPSKVGDAWDKAMAKLPAWLRALLSGVAAVAPILVLIAAIYRIRDQRKASFPTFSPVLPALYALLLVALAAAAQPFFFTFYSAVIGGVGAESLLFDSRADGGSSYPDPYIPMALAIALMLVPFLRAVNLPNVRSIEPSRTIHLFVFAMIGVVLLLVF